MNDPNHAYTIRDLRADLAATIRALREKTMTVEEARAVSEVGQTLINSAKVEVDMLRVLGRRQVTSTGFVPLEHEDTLAQQERRERAALGDSSR